MGAVRDAFVELTRQLVAIDSVNPSLVEGGAGEREIARFVADWAVERGLQAEIVEETRGRPSVIVRAAGSGAGRSLLLCAHMDTVGVEGVVDPLAARVDGDRMYGRGAYDMKSGVGINLFVVRLINDLNINLKGDLKVHSVIEEECTGNGALIAAETDPADACLIPESTNGAMTAAHPGVIWFRVKITGRSAHAGSAWLGVNAIVKSVPVINALAKLNDDLNLQLHPLWAGQKHPINLNIGVIQGGDWPSTVPGECELHCRTSFFPGTSVEDMQAKIESAIAEATASDDWLRENPPVISYDGFRTNGVILDQSDPFIDLLQATVSDVTGQPLEARIGTAVTDQRYYTFAGMPATCYGASGDGAHAVDEWLDLTSLPSVARVYAEMILDWCGVAE
jgi:acetylornithine deacetylase